jgi:hypothetical protein
MVQFINGGMSPELARTILKWGFSKKDHHRMAKLQAKASQGNLTAADQEELDQYLRAADMLAILQSKARRAIKLGKVLDLHAHGTRTPGPGACRGFVRILPGVKAPINSLFPWITSVPNNTEAKQNSRILRKHACVAIRERDRIWPESTNSREKWSVSSILAVITGVSISGGKAQRFLASPRSAGLRLPCWT